MAPEALGGYTIRQTPTNVQATPATLAKDVPGGPAARRETLS